MIQKILTSGHNFINHNNLMKFRFTLFNSILIIIIFFTLLNYVSSVFGLIHLTKIYENVLFIYIIINIFLIYILRKDIKYYELSVHISLITSFIVFFIALCISPIDEFRLIWFYLLLFAGFVLMGKYYGLFLMFFTLISVFIANSFIDLEYSTLSLFTFFNSFIIFAAFAYFFLNKIEKDEKEFQVLNLKLKEKISKEVQQRKEQEQILLQQCRLASMGEMIDSIAHQWRQPLMNINAILMNMERGFEIHTNPKPYLELKMDEVITLTTHMSQTIEDFRSLFKDNKKGSIFYIKDAIEQGITLLGNHHKDIDIQLNSLKEVTFYGHKNEFIQVIIILLSNAIEALTNRQIYNKQIILTFQEEKKNLILYIEDNAGGIDNSIIDSIFDPYFTTKDAVGGTGLGLYIAKIIIEENMQGLLSVINTKNGTQFKISIPKSKHKGKIIYESN